MNIHKILADASDLHIAVVGDFIEDHYIIGEVTRISPEAPVPVVRISSTHKTPGGAANVEANLIGLGCKVDFFCDPHNRITKTRVMCRSQHMLRIDDEDDPKYRSFEEMLWANSFTDNVLDRKYDCVIISDYHKGVVSDDVAQRIIQLCCAVDIPVVVDAKKDFHKFGKATILKCNKEEAKGIKIDHMLYNLPVDNFIVTSGDQGLCIYYRIENQDYDGEAFSAYPVEIVDVCGAGDTVTAILGMMIGLKLSVYQAGELANIAASEVCRHPGVYAIKKEDLIKRFKEVQ